MHTEPKNSVFVNHSLKIANGVYESNLDVPFMVLVANFSNNRLKINKKIVVGCDTRNPTLRIILRTDSYLVANVHKSLVFAAQDGPKIPESKQTSNRQEHISTTANQSNFHMFLRSSNTLTEKPRVSNIPLTGGNTSISPT